jgi:hypothetical protein
LGFDSIVDRTKKGVCDVWIMAMYSPRAPIWAAALDHATRRLTHRGPDAQRTWVSDDRRVGLGHVRLSIIDLATGDQPIASEDERLRIDVNGEFYELERTQRDLEGRGHHLRTRSDSEIALHLYEELGTACLHELRGERRGPGRWIARHAHPVCAIPSIPLSTARHSSGQFRRMREPNAELM